MLHIRLYKRIFLKGDAHETILKLHKVAMGNKTYLRVSWVNYQCNRNHKGIINCVPTY